MAPMLSNISKGDTVAVTYRGVVTEINTGQYPHVILNDDERHYTEEFDEIRITMTPDPGCPYEMGTLVRTPETNEIWKVVHWQFDSSTTSWVVICESVGDYVYRKAFSPEIIEGINAEYYAQPGVPFWMDGEWWLSDGEVLFRALDLVGHGEPMPNGNNYSVMTAKAVPAAIPED